MVAPEIRRKRSDERPLRGHGALVRTGLSQGGGVVATISDVAQLSGASPATVSRVMNGKPRVNPELRERVLAAVKELGYQPNKVARSLRTRASSVLALMVSDISNPFFGSVIRGVEDVARGADYLVVLFNTDEDVERERRYLSIVIAERMAGVIISPTSERQTDLSPLTERGIPVVAVDRLPKTAGTDTVRSDNVEGARLATAHLLDQGYRRIGYVGGPAAATTSRERLVGYKAALRQGHVWFDRRLLSAGDFKEESGQVRMTELLNAKPDAVLVANHTMAIGALRSLREAGLRYPDDLGFVSFDDPPWASLTHPSLTVMAQADLEIGRQAAHLLGKRILEPNRPAVSAILQPELRVRESSIRPLVQPSAAIPW